MKHVFLCLVLMALIAPAYSQETITTFILTRHAEKGDDGTKDPDLSPAGKERAQLLMKMLQKTKVDAVYSTNYKRTRNTVTPLAEAKGLTVLMYDPTKTDEIEGMLKKFAGGTIVVSGHSNTIPSMINYLTGSDSYITFEDTDYSNLILVTVVDKGKATKVTWLTY